MTRKEAYEEAFADGQRWAEDDLRNGRHTDSILEGMRAKALLQFEFGTSVFFKVLEAGRTRGYQDTLIRYERGTLTREMFDQAPRSPA